MKAFAAALAALAAVATFAPAGQAHKGVTSKFTYNEDVHPIFLNRCGHCHAPGGVGPMSLLTYEDAFPWAESLRVELLETEGEQAGEARDAAGFVKMAHRDLSARELDVVLDWATGGTPEGDAAKAPKPVELKNEWTHGAPHLTLQTPAPYLMPADAMETTQELTLPIALTAPRELNAVDVLPGTPAIVRDITVALRTSGSAPSVIATWTPKQNPAPVVISPPVRIAPGADLIARIHYKKTWKYEGRPMSDQSTIGLYFAP